MALQAQLELFRPLDTGIWESVSSVQPAGSSIPAASQALLTHMRAISVFSEASFIILTVLPLPEAVNLATVSNATPMVAPMPQGMALTTVIDPWDLPVPVMGAASSWHRTHRPCRSTA